MVETKIKLTSSGNCNCFYCSKLQDGIKPQPVTLWYKVDNEKRGHQLPMCSIECAEHYIKEFLR